jgi:anionic cell wall polymer biosynthesis LytR-Cps2A-Psr (LCP) family protein
VRPLLHGTRLAPLLASLVLAALLSSPAGLAWGAAPTPTAQGEPGLRVALDAMRQLATDSRSNKEQRRTTRPRGGLPVSVGADGRLTVLLIGSDWRPDALGERLDVLMVATIDPTTGTAAMVSIPRDMAGIPFHDGASSGGMRVNSIYFIRYRDADLPHAAIDRGALKKFSKDVGALLGTQIDYWALTRFGTFANLVNTLGGVRLDVEAEVLDTSYHHGSSRGVWFPVQDDYLLKGDPKCKPKPKKCHSALVYARSRKGTMGGQWNDDYRRAERQQEIVRAAVTAVLEDRGAGVALLGTLLRVRDLVETNLPKTSEAAGQLYALLEDARLARSNMKVLAPSQWASPAGDGSIRPNLPVIRDWVDRRFYRVRPASGGD